MTVGRLIKSYREKANLTQKELGEKLGVTESYISQYERGKRVPKPDTLTRIAEALGVSIETLASDLEKQRQYYESRVFSTSGKRVLISYEDLSLAMDQSEIDDIEERIRIFVHNLNAEGQTKILAYVEDISKIPAYKELEE